MLVLLPPSPGHCWEPALVVGRAVPAAPLLLGWLLGTSQRAALHVQKHFTLQSRVSGWWAQLEGKCRELLSSSCRVTNCVSPQSAQVLLALRMMSNLLEELTGATQECLVSPFWRLPPPQQLPSPPWAFSSFIQQNPAALQKRAASLLPQGGAGAAAGLGEPQDGGTLSQPCSGLPPAPHSPCAELARAEGLNPDSELKIMILVNESYFSFFFFFAQKLVI